MGVGKAERGDHPVAASLGRSQRYEKNLILIVLHGFAQFPLELQAFRGIEVALEDRELEVRAMIFANFENAIPALVVRDVVADEKCASHFILLRRAD